MVSKVLMSSSSEYWCTPETILGPLRDKLGQIVLDPCSNGYSTVRADYEWIPPEHNGLTEEWLPTAKGGLVFVNPPYGRKITGLWTRKIANEVANGCEVVALLPARTDTRWFHSLTQGTHKWAPSVCFIKGRIKFVDGLTGLVGTSAPFPSCLVYFGRQVSAFEDLGARLGLVFAHPCAIIS